MKPIRTLPLLALCTLAACGDAGNASLSPGERHAAVAALAARIDAHYVDPAAATRIAAQLRARERSGAYAAARDEAALAKALSADLLRLGGDARLRVRRTPDPAPGWFGAWFDDGGIASVARIGSDIGYIDIAAFTGAARAGKPLARAFGKLADANTIIVDLRRNAGGDPDGLRLLTSYVVDRPVRYAQSAHRGGSLEHSWAMPQWAARTYLEQLYILVGPQTGAEAENFAYAMQAYKRATVVGTRSAGVASASSRHPLSQHLVADVPDARPVLPLTHATWHGAGVAPDIVVRGDAFTAAKRIVIDQRLAHVTTPMGRRALLALRNDL